jgi:L-lactate dehydrogenase (cytochrome)
MNFEARNLKRCRNIADLRGLAKRRLPAPIFHFIDGGAEDEVTMRRNVEAFDDYEIEAEYAVDVSHVETKTTVLGQEIDMPVMLSPTGLTGAIHPHGELCVARATARAGTTYMMSCMSTATIEEVGAASGGSKILQAYTFRDRGLTREFIERSKAAGFSALCLTYDVPVLGKRDRDHATGMTLPPSLTLSSLLDFALKPGWSLRYLMGPKVQIGNIAHRINEGSRDVSSVFKFVNGQFDPSATWADAAEMIRHWSGPVAIKGVMTAADAKRARDAGATAVIVSNHGGRQLDGGPAAIDRLAVVVEAVGDELEVILDSGVRRGSHVIKALALGAKACTVGRAYLYGLGAGGEPGVDRALTLLREEIERAMALSGFRQVSEITRDRVTHRRAW